MKIVVSGASGFLAAQLIGSFIEDGHELVLIGREPRKLLRWQSQCVIATPEDWGSYSQGAKLFVHLAVLNTGSVATREDFFAVNHLLVKKYATQARALGIEYFLFPSSVHTLDSFRRTSYALSKKAGEEVAREIYGSRAVVFQLGTLYGEKFAGKLKWLNRLPRLLVRVVVPLALSLRPVTNISLVIGFIRNGIHHGFPPITVLTDEKLLSSFYRGWMVFLNLLFVFVTITVFPVLLLVGIAIFVFDGYPVVHIQDRLGRGGQVFRMLKFRTMLNRTPIQPTDQTDRGSVTAIGKVLRATKIDELPQFLNVISGHMNLIGPRPALPSQSSLLLERRIRGVDKVLPGITGWSQVNSIDMSQPTRLAQSDFEYLKTRGILKDIQIIWKTVFPGGPGKN